MIKKYLFQRVKISSILLCLFLIAGIYLFHCLDNACASTVRINKPKIRLNIPSGSSESGSITVSNPSTGDVNVKVYLEDWEYEESQDGVKRFFPPGTHPLSCAKWISFYPADFSLPSYGSQELFYSVKAPKDVNGGYFAVLFFEKAMGEMKDSEGANILIKGRIGSLFYVETGAVNKKVELTNISIAKKRNGLEISTVLKNTGNVDVTAKGTFNIIDKQGMVFARGEFNDTYTFPGSQARISSTWADAVPVGDYDLIITLDLAGSLKIEEVEIRINSSGGIVHVGSNH